MSHAKPSVHGLPGIRTRLVTPLQKVAESPLSLVVVAVLLLIAFGSLFYLDRQLNRDHANLNRLAVNAERILGSDGDTTTAVRLAAALHSMRYILSYDDITEARDTLMKQSIALVSTDALSQAFRRVLDTQKSIEKIERQAIEWMHYLRWEDALELVTEPSFRRDKGIYRAGLSGALRQLVIEAGQTTRKTEALRSATQGFVLVAFLLLAVLGLSYSRRIRRALASEVGLRDDLRRANAELEERVEVRTRELSNKEAQLRIAMENMPGGMFMVDADRNFVLANTQYQDLFEFPEGLLAEGASLDAMVRFQAERGDYGPGEVDALAADVGGRLLSGAPAHYVRELANGRVLEIHLAPTPEGGAVAVATDVTERRNAEIVAREKMDEMEKFTGVAVGRELRMIALKEEINRLSVELGRGQAYEIVE